MVFSANQRIVWQTSIYVKDLNCWLSPWFKALLQLLHVRNKNTLRSLLRKLHLPSLTHCSVNLQQVVWSLAKKQ